MGTLHEEYANEINDEINIDEGEKSKINELLQDVKNISTLLQLDSPGFLKNERQHRQFTIAVVHAAQQLNQVVEETLNGAVVEYTWRDMFKIISKYRQLADFKDIVFWIDKFPPVQKREDLWMVQAIGHRVQMVENERRIGHAHA